jgi:curved DNA-binding protein CbpA
MDSPDFYEVLQVDPNATEEDIRAAFKRLAFAYHPDHSNLPDATHRMQQLNEAYGVLGDVEKRFSYDQERQIQTIVIQVDESPEVIRPTPTKRSNRSHPVVLLFNWIPSPLKILLWLTSAMFGMFLWALVTGYVNYVAILALILLAIPVILSVIVKVRISSAPNK